MSKLDNKLLAILDDLEAYFAGDSSFQDMSPAWAVAQIKQVFAEELKIDDMIQDMENIRSTMQQDMIRLGLTGVAPGLMSGQEWYDRFDHEITKLPIHKSSETGKFALDFEDVLEAAERAAGLES